LHAAIFSSSVFALMLTVCALDVPGIAERFSTRTPRRIVGTVLALLAAALGVIWIYASVRFITSGEPPVGSALVESDVVVQLGLALDLTLLVPAYALAAVLLWRRTATGYVLATVLLIAGTLHQVSYMVALLFQSRAGVPGAVVFDPFEPVIAALYLMATVALLVAAGPRYRRGAVRSAPAKAFSMTLNDQDWGNNQARGLWAVQLRTKGPPPSRRKRAGWSRRWST
jgi:hypothetical protein